ncbi:2515_t:CDS:2, partial [Racocetra persica]
GVSKISEYLHTIADCTTRWNSSYLKDLKYLKKILLLDDEWDAINDLVEILQPFTEANNYLGGTDINDDDDDNNFQDLFDNDTSDEEEEDEQNYTPISINIDEIKNNLHNTINHYWPNLTLPSSLLPSLLDP